MEFAANAILCSPLIATVIAGILLQSGLKTSPKVGWWRVGLGIILLGFTCFGLFYQASFGLHFPVFAFLMGSILACAVIIAGILMLWKLRGPGRYIALVVSIVFPIALYFGISTGIDQAPENVTQRNGNIIIQALDRYHAKAGTYPNKLADLESTYLTVEPVALTTQGTGWMYISTGAEFTLGYWFWPYKFGADVCLYKSQTRKWECDTDNWGPFREIPTPERP